ncbi:carcinoembryonic antigen-related cell adhesion molecule 1-like [Megalops cyprinoides]|uniref:carcinoembryonic antigen-related cell adhesion molecule 1-like n=1 Tax=Megalops cyprinoides TaxID=118141 RepID=UPI001863A156|nr:carcinoembryonic antigen-related cell adhesion molecule 1-like [Megalops cyprinoides]
MVGRFNCRCRGMTLLDIFSIMSSLKSQCLKISRRVNILLLMTGFLCGGSEGLAVAAAGSITSVTVGESVLFPVSPEGEHSYCVNLIFRSIPIVTWYSETNDSYVHNQYKNRISIRDAGSVWLNTVRLSDSGLYQIKIQYISGDLRPPTYSDFHLQVFEPVSSPSITVECLGNNISLSCFSSQGSEVTYSWETLSPYGNDSCVHLGQRMECYSTLLSESITYRCTAKNPVSRASSDPVDLAVCPVQGPKGFLCGGSEGLAVAAAGSITNVTVGENPVSSPNITVECKRDSISLSCSSSQGSEVTYSWETLSPCSNESCIRFGQTIEMDSFLQAESVTYRCTAQNPVSRASSDPMALQGCSTQGAKGNQKEQTSSNGPGHHVCFPSDSRATDLPCTALYSCDKPRSLWWKTS